MKKTDIYSNADIIEFGRKKWQEGYLQAVINVHDDLQELVKDLKIDLDRCIKSRK